MKHAMKSGLVYDISPATLSQWNEAMTLAYKVFLKFEAKEYGKEGTQNFLEFVTSTSLEKMFKAGHYVLYVAILEEKVIGVVSLRNENHISLLFVDEKYHRQGIGQQLIKTMQDFLLKNTKQEFMTVNASPYGEPFYKRVGFKATDVRTTQDGVIFTPMQMYL